MRGVLADQGIVYVPFDHIFELTFRLDAGFGLGREPKLERQSLPLIAAFLDKAANDQLARSNRPI
jgi:hypothetical protein